jgi:D-xylose transport system substrate-binding protein
MSTSMEKRRRRRLGVLLGIAGVGTFALAACGGSNNTSGGGGNTGGNQPGKIALLLPETKTTRYEAADKPYFLQKLKDLGYDTSQVIYSNANQDAALQQNQADAAITNGAKVLVLDPVDSKSAASIANKAKQSGIPVISYDRLITGSTGVNYYISFDNEKVGQLQAQALTQALTAAGKTAPHIVMINGSPTDNNAGLFKKGAHSVFDPLVSSGKMFIDKEYDTPDWSPDQAQNEMQQALTALSNKVDGVYAANDGTGGGAIAAMKAAGVTPIPPTTGQDAELAGIQRIIAGQQFMTVYKAIKPEAAAAASMAFALASGKQPSSDLVSSKVNNGAMDVPSQLLTPVSVTKANVKDTVVKDAFHSASEICTADYAQYCTQLGIS